MSIYSKDMRSFEVLGGLAFERRGYFGAGALAVEVGGQRARLRSAGRLSKSVGGR
jgi:hypothetical protein